jgi:hypothetical protein
MKKNFKLLVASLLVGSTLTMLSCTKTEEVIPTPEPENISVVEVKSNIEVSTTWTKDKTYILAGRIIVTAGATLTIESGTIIKGRAGAGANASALVIARNAKIMAEGTASEPIIFTSEADVITSGMIESPNMPNNLNGLWGGVIVLGNAKASLKGNVSEQAIEGIPATDSNGKYGGSNDSDNSGVLKYISIRHGGANIGEGNEINGLTLGSVGNGTTIENIEIVANQDDGVELFGGTVNLKNVIVWNNGDDAIDTDQAWAGTLDNVVIINPGDKGFELDGPEGDYKSAGHTITNGTLYAGSAGGLIDFDDNSDVTMTNIFFTDLNNEKVDGVISQTISGYAGYIAANEYTSASFEVVLPQGTTIAEYFTEGSASITAAVTSNTVGANTSVFAGWSWAATASGKF